jgi:hypothetical protein
LLAGPARAADQVRFGNNLGVGLGGGTYATGFSLKYFLDAPLAVQGNIGWWRSHYACVHDRCYGGGESLAVSADLLWEMPTFAGNQAVKVAWLLGGGAGIGIDERGRDLGLGVSFVIGIELLIDRVPLDVVLEYRPGAYFLPGVGFDPINFTGHIRYYL